MRRPDEINPLLRRNTQRAAEAAEQDFLIAQQILADPPDVPESWLLVCRERGRDRTSSWPEVGARLGVSFYAAYARWRRLMTATGRRPPDRPRPPQSWGPPPPGAVPEVRQPPAWLAEYRVFSGDTGYSPSRGTARFAPDEVAS